MLFTDAWEQVSRVKPTETLTYPSCRRYKRADDRSEIQHWIKELSSPTSSSVHLGGTILVRAPSSTPAHKSPNGNTLCVRPYLFTPFVEDDKRWGFFYISMHIAGARSLLYTLKCNRGHVGSLHVVVKRNTGSTHDSIVQVSKPITYGEWTLGKYTL